LPTAAVRPPRPHRQHPPIHQNRRSCVSYAFLIADNLLVNFLQPKKHPLHTEDFNLLLNFLESSTVFQTNESWIPICLPKFNDGGYLYAYLVFLAPNVCLLLISTVKNSEKFYELAKWKNVIDKSLKASGALTAIVKSLHKQRMEYRVGNIGISGLISFVFKNCHFNQFTSPAVEPPFNSEFHKKRIFKLYQYTFDWVKDRKILDCESHKVFFKSTERETILVWVTIDFEIFILFEPFVTKAMAINSANQIVRWIKQRESVLFLGSTQSNVW
jgi:hypothetical protein